MKQDRDNKEVGGSEALPAVYQCEPRKSPAVPCIRHSEGFIEGGRPSYIHHHVAQEAAGSAIDNPKSPHGGPAKEKI